MTQIVWRVTGYLPESGNLFEAYFSNKNKAKAVFEEGRQEYAGVVWEMAGFVLDHELHIDEMFKNVRDAMEE